MTHIKYPKIYRLGHEDTDFILEGECVIQEKIDGANASIWVEENTTGVHELHFGSRTRDLGAESFNGFKEYVASHTGILEYLIDNPTHRLFGEWLVRHTISYDETSYRKFYLFDIFYDFELKEEDWEFKRIESLDVEQIAAKYGILYPKIFAVITNPTEKYINEFIGETTLGPKGEGVVIKNFSYVNKWGRQTYAKVVSEKFKEDNAVVFGGNNKHSDTYNEMWVVNKFMTVSRVQKTMDKLQPIIDKRLDMEHTGRVINTAYHDLITEEIWTIQKKFNSINFRNLARVAQKKAAQIYHDILNNNLSIADAEYNTN